MGRWRVTWSPSGAEAMNRNSGESVTIYANVMGADKVEGLQDPIDWSVSGVLLSVVADVASYYYSYESSGVAHPS